MTRVILTLVLFAASAFATAGGLGEWRDLNVRVDALAEPILVNGLPLAVSRATGRDVDLLAKRLRRQWSDDSGVDGIRLEVHGTWTIMSRIHDAGMEVVQWHGAGPDAELLWSRSELRSTPVNPVRGELRFPIGCAPGRIVGGRVDTRAYSQQSARCKDSPDTTLNAVRTIARKQGYEVLSREGQLLARNRNSEVTVLAMPSGDGRAAGTSLVYLRLESPERSQ